MARYSKFNFVFFLASERTATSKITFYDAYALSNVRAIDVIVNNTSKKKLIHFAPYRPENNPAVFQNIQDFSMSNPKIFSADFPTKNPIVFFTIAGHYNMFRDSKFFDYLRANYPNCKLVCFLFNPVHYYQSAQKIFINKSDTDKIFSTFDLLMTYNYLDAMEYGLTYFDGSYSVLPFEQPKETVDVLYIGAAKNRLEKILRAYESFKRVGFTCDFYITGVPNTPPTIYNNDLHINQSMSYIEVLQRVLRSRAVLDIAHIKNYGLTMRYFESLAYNKNFITDNPFYRQDRFASPKLFLIDKGFDIDKKKFMNAAELSSNYKNEYSPLRLVSFLESVLNK